CFKYPTFCHLMESVGKRKKENWGENRRSNNNPPSFPGNSAEKNFNLFCEVFVSRHPSVWSRDAFVTVTRAL
ncbi:MAG: hypothetical protein ACI3YZ_09080, partial [Prevotella sp.]